ncbi:MAG: DUF447 family protein [Proteobacteria bacterium]|nr:DUF447 family protein [Pseudomonadota bacterium]
MIFETLVTTQSAAGVVHLAPMGVRYDGDEVVLMPFKPSTTLANIGATRCAVLNLTDDVRVFAGCVTGRRDFVTSALQDFPGCRLADTLAHVELELLRFEDDALRPVLHMARRREMTHGAFRGFNRAQAAVIEGAVLVSRLGMLPRDKVEGEMAYLQIAIDKTAGPAELEAWGWLVEAVQRHQGGLSAAEAA